MHIPDKLARRTRRRLPKYFLTAFPQLSRRSEVRRCGVDPWGGSGGTRTPRSAAQGRGARSIVPAGFGCQCKHASSMCDCSDPITATARSSEVAGCTRDASWKSCWTASAFDLAGNISNRVRAGGRLVLSGLMTGARTEIDLIRLLRRPSQISDRTLSSRSEAEESRCFGLRRCYGGARWSRAACVLNLTKFCPRTQGWRSPSPDAGLEHLAKIS